MSRFQIFTRLILITILLLPAVSCGAPPGAASPWTAGDLRLLDPAGNAETPATDILAVYLRVTSTDFEIRVDLLDLSFESEYKLGVFIFEDESISPPLSVFIEPDKVSRVLDHATSQWSNIQPRVVRNPWLDTITIRFNRHLLEGRNLIAVGTYLPSDAPEQTQLAAPGQTVQNSTPLIGLDDPPPAARASVLIAFTNTFPAATPAQALRRWDGAHTGPTGERHGLRLILDGVRANNIPVALLDLKTPSSLAALDFIGALGDIRTISKKELLILPDVANGEPVDISFEISRRATRDFNLPPSPFVTSPDLVPGARYQFISLPDTTHISISGSTRLIPLPPADPTPQATMDGPSLEVRRTLMDTALSADTTKLLILGGSLPDSTWGQADRAAPTFAWLAAHPWVHVLDEKDLKTFPVGASDQPQVFLTTDSVFLSGLQAAPKNAVTSSAWQTCVALTAPTSDPSLRAMQLNYLSQVGTLTAASQWADKPFAQSDCSVDFDHDLQPECILANQNYFAIIETDGARLTHLFYGEHQLIAPTAQFAIGLSDPSEWNKVPGDGADPGQIMGAFFDESQPYQPYAASWSAPDALTLTSVDGSRVKTFRLTESGLEVTYQVFGSVSTKIPLAVDPQKFFSGAGEYAGTQSAGSWTWGTAEGSQVRVRTDTAISAVSFIDSLPLLGSPEDPNLDYPPGHYLPFPLSLVTVRSDGNFRVQIDAVK